MSIQMNAVLFSEAVQNKEFVFVYQPKVSMATGLVSGAEALIRWQSANGVIIGPDSFIPYAEQQGLIRQITQIAIDNAVKQLHIMKLTQRPIPIAVNITYQDLEDDQLLDYLRDLIESNKLDASLLELEITERTIIKSPKQVQNRLAQLAASGVTISIDDFGTGYTSLEVLSNLPFSRLKLDRSIVAGLMTNKKKERIVSSSIRMARMLNMTTVAEGIEDKLCYEKLMRMGCSYGQGYWLSRPVEFEQLLEITNKRQWKGNPSGLLHLIQLDHMEWRKDILEEVSYLVDMSKQEKKKIDVDMLVRQYSNHQHCNLGKWYYGAGQVFKQYQGFTDMEAAHSALHRAGANLVRMAVKEMSILRLLEEMNLLNELSGQLIIHLEKLETQIQYDTLKFNQLFSERDFLQRSNLMWNQSQLMRHSNQVRTNIISRNIHRFPAG
ncbi:MAG: EAL domain-containing protein [Magnetococcales bacterium]|nr:EAL domain-containing protein [Magnetococcales bacterium]